MWIFTGVPWGMTSNDSGVVDNGNFQRLARYFFGNLRGEASVIIWRYTQSDGSFSVIPKCVTLDDPEWLFRVKFCFRTGFIIEITE